MRDVPDAGMSKKPLPGTTISKAPSTPKKITDYLPQTLREGLLGTEGQGADVVPREQRPASEKGLVDFFAPFLRRSESERIDKRASNLIAKGIAEDRAYDLSLKSLRNEDIADLTDEEKKVLRIEKLKETTGLAVDVVGNIPLVGATKNIVAKSFERIAQETNPTAIAKFIRETFKDLSDPEVSKNLGIALNDISEPSQVQKIIEHAINMERAKTPVTTRYWYDNLPKAKSDEVVVSFVETPGNKQYINTVLDNQKQYEVTPQFGVIKRELLEDTGDINKTQNGVYTIPRALANKVVLENTTPQLKRIPIKTEDGRFAGSFMDQPAKQVTEIPSLREAEKQITQAGVFAQIDNASLPAKNAYASQELAKSLGLNRDYLYKNATEQNVDLNEWLKKLDATPEGQRYDYGSKIIEVISPGKRSFTEDDILFDRSLKEVQERLETIFGRKVPIKTTTRTEDLGGEVGKKVYGRASGDTIKLLENNNTFSEAVANHEGWHWFLRNLSDTKRKELEALQKELYDARPDLRAQVERDYDPKKFTPEQIAEEMMAEEFARFTKTPKIAEQTTLGKKLKQFFEDAVEALLRVFKIRDDVMSRVEREFSKVKKTLKEEGGTPQNTSATKQKSKAEGVQQAEAEVLTEMEELSQAGYRYRTNDFETKGVASTFPKWIPEHLRSKSLFEGTIKHYEADTIPPGVKQRELLAVMEKEIQARGNEYEELLSYEPRSIGGEAQQSTLPPEIQQDQELLRSQLKDVSLQPTVQPKEDAVKLLMDALKVAKPLEKKQAEIYSKIRSQQTAKVASTGARVKGEQGFFAQKGALKGGMPKVEFESIRKSLSQENVDILFNMVEETTSLYPLERVSAKAGLAKLIGAEGGAVPTNSELKLLQEVFPKEMIDAILEKRSLYEKAWGIIANVLNVPRAIMSSIDVSAPLRQGILFTTKPKQFVPAFADMFKYLVSEKRFNDMMASIKARPTYKAMREADLALLDLGGDVTMREEQFMSNLAEKIPGFGRMIRASSRAYTGFLNKLRADVFDDLYKKAKYLGVNVDTHSLARYINSATGRGDLGMFNRSAPVLNALFFSPRLMASRINMLNPVYYAKLDPFVRKEALKTLITFASVAGTVLGLAKLGGADVEADPRSADFAKIKVDDTRYDILGGFQQYIRLASQLITGEILSSTTGRTITLGEGYKPLTRKDILIRFFESKESPVASFVTGLLTGQDSLGRDFNVTEESLSRFIPLIVQDLYDLHANDKSLFRGALAPLGVGTMTYGPVELREGKSKLGQDTSAILPPKSLAGGLADKIQEQPLATSKSFDIEKFYDQLLEMPKEQAAEVYDSLKEQNPELAKKLSTVAKERKLGLTAHDKDLKDKGVASGDRALAIQKDFDKLTTKEEKAKLWEEYTKKGIITDDVKEQLLILLKQ